MMESQVAIDFVLVLPLKILFWTHRSLQDLGVFGVGQSVLTAANFNSSITRLLCVTSV